MTSESFPQALHPIRGPQEPNEAILIYSGPMELTQGEVVEQGNATLSFIWLPSPYIKFEFSNNNSSSSIGLDDPKTSPAFLRIPALSNPVQASIRSVSKDPYGTGGLLKVTGQPLEPLVEGEHEKLSYAVFNLPNFHNYRGYGIRSIGIAWSGRVIFEAEGWKVTLDSAEDLRKTTDRLRVVGGYGITHVGKLERLNGESFSTEEADDMLEALFFLFSFMRGLEVSPLFPTGFDQSGNRVWEKLSVGRISPWQYVDSWFLGEHIGSFVKLFPGFMGRWKDMVWGKVIRLVIDWYLESNSANNVSSLFLSQAALELLSWVSLVEEVPTESERSIPNRASDRLRNLLLQAGIDLNIPKPQQSLIELSITEKWQDGPQAITTIRNSLTHPKITSSKTHSKDSPSTEPRSVIMYPIPARYEAIQLSLWWIERFLMYLFSYDGPMNDNRLRKYVIT